MWYCKMYFPGRHEVIESDAFGTQGAPSRRKTFPFLESLLSFTELDMEKVSIVLRCISDDLESLDRERVTNAMAKLGALADTHSFFRVLYTKWFYLHSVGFENATTAVSEALNELPKAVDGSAKNFFSYSFVNRQRFSRHNRLVNRSLTTNDHSINRDRFTRQNTQNISLPDFLCRYHFFFPVLSSASLCRRKANQRFEPLFRPVCRGFL